MLQTRVFPCLLLRNSCLVKTIHFKNPTYIGDPINTTVIFNEKEVDELVFLDITATTENKKPDFNIIREIASECFMPFAYGGGIKNVDDARKIFNLGAEKIVLNSAAVENPTVVSKLADSFGSQSIVISIDVKKTADNEYNSYICSGTKPTGIDPAELARRMEKLGAGEIFLNSIDKDGTMRGYDLTLIKRVSEAVNIPVIACGGAGCYEDIGAPIIAGGAHAAAAGSIFVYMGKNRAVLINFPQRNELRAILGSKYLT